MDEQPVETTIYSLGQAVPGPGERRGDERHLTLYRVGSLALGDRRELCLIKNISAGGMMIRAYCALPPGTELSIELKSGQPVHGRVSWVEDPNVGVAFDEPIDVIEILSASAEGPRPRMPRIAVACVATVRDGANVHRLGLCDISQGGVKLAGDIAFEHPCDVAITLPGMPPLAAALRWRHEGQIGLSFHRLIPLGELVAWLGSIKTRMRAAG